MNLQKLYSFVILFLKNAENCSDHASTFILPVNDSLMFKVLFEAVRYHFFLLTLLFDFRWARLHFRENGWR